MISFKLLKQAFLAGGILCASVPALAQENYLKLGGTYNIGLGSSVAAYSADGTVHKDNSADFNITQHKVNFGEGWLFQVAAGHFFTENIGAELSFGLLPGKKHLLESQTYYSGVGVTEGYDKTYSARMFLFQPSLVVRMSPKTITPYARLGFIVAKGSMKETIKNTLWTESRDYETEYTGGLGFGFQTGFGVDFTANNQITFFSEVNFNNLGWTPEKRTLLSYRRNNASALDAIPPGDRETIYTDKFQEKYDKNGNLIKSEGPSHGLKSYMPMNSIGLSLGVKYNF